MSYRAVFYHRDFSPALLPAEEALVLRLSWRSEGGADACTLALRAFQGSFESFQNLLRCPVEVYSEQGQLVWWGYVHALRQTRGSYQVKVNLETLANRVAVAYQSLTPSQAYGDALRTDWQENSRSITVYGTRERLVQAGMLSDAAALQLARRELAESALPSVRCEPRGTRESIEKAAEEALEDAALLYLECRGWFETLSWKYAQVSESVVANAAPVTGVQNLGNESSTNRVAQSFSFAAASKLAMIEVRLRRQGNPSDSLMLEIQADLGGQPEGSPTFTASLSSASLPESHYAYVSIPVSPLLNLSAGRTYWLVAKRSGATHASNYYCLAVDEGLAYSGGQCLLYTTVPGRWQPRGVPADLIFRLHAQRLNFTQMAEIFSASNQFMRACTFDGSNSPATPLYKAQLVNGRDAFLELLRLGTNELGGLSCQVRPDLGLCVSALPPKSKPGFQLSEDGRLRDAFGVSLAPGVHPAGAWLRFGNGPALFVREAILDALSGEMRIST